MDDYIEFIVRGHGSDIWSDLSKPMLIPEDLYVARLGLKNFSTYNNIPNVEVNVNNKLKIKVPDHEYKLFSLETGAYELKMIAKQIHNWIGVKYPHLKDVEENFQLVGNEATSKAEFIFKDGYGVDFNVPASMHKILGFAKNKKIEGLGRYPAKEIINIVTVTQIVFNCSVTTSNYINGKESPFLYNCGIDVPVGYRLSRELTDISYKKLTTTQLSRIRVWVVDQDGAPVNLRDDELTVTLSLQLKPHAAKVSIV